MATAPALIGNSSALTDGDHDVGQHRPRHRLGLPHSTCGKGSASLAAIANAIGDQQQGTFDGLGGGFAFVSNTSQSFSFQVYLRDDPAVLADADTYALTITQGSTTLAHWSAPAVYDTTYPNGIACDPVPCRLEAVSVP